MTGVVRGEHRDRDRELAEIRRLADQVQPAPSAQITFRRWVDPVIDECGYAFDAPYVEWFWLPTIGPSALLLGRRVATMFAPNLPVVECTVDLEVFAPSMGLSPARLLATLGRLEMFGLARQVSDGWQVRTVVSEVPARSRRRWPAALQEAHDTGRWPAVLIGGVS